MHPIENRPECSRCHDPNQPLIGLLLTDLSIAPVEKALAVDLRDNLIWWAGTVVLTAGLANLAVNRWVLRRLHGLTSALEAFGRGAAAGSLPERPADEIGRLSAAFNAMAAQVERRDGENRALSAALQERWQERGQLLRRVIGVQEEERRRVARELHDDLGQALGSAALTIEAAQRTMDTDRRSALGHLAQARRLIADASDRMYDLILGLRPSSLDDLGLVAALRALGGRKLEQAGLAYEVQAHGLTVRLPPEVETALFRIFQEALANVVRHAQARHVRLRLGLEAGAVVGEMSDDGQGFDPTALGLPAGGGRGLGLLGMRERAAQVGGRLEIESRPGHGTRLQVRVPLGEAGDG